ncbi:MAG: Protein translocase subunit SecD [Microgenomates bacterium OLB22]|nr:MAG: Protein translocase subunit SecD [Microgenomates bacterium OLB22]
MKPRFSTIFFILFIILCAWISLPQKLSIPIPFSSKKDHRVTVGSPVISIPFFGKKIERTFETKLGLDLLGGAQLVFDADVSKLPIQDRDAALLSARDIIERRVNFFGVSEPSIRIQKVGASSRITVELPGVEDAAEATALIGQTAQVDFRELSDPNEKIATDTPIFMQLQKKTDLKGDDIKRAVAQFSQQDGQPVVLLELLAREVKKFGEITARNIGKPVGIFLDGAPLLTPTVQQEIRDQAVISGGFTLDEAKSLAIAINSGALPVPIKLIEKRTIGPTLGGEQVAASMVAGFVGLLGVMSFYAFILRSFFGVIAVVALTLYGIISYALFKIIPVVLTLSGLAGFILSIGMAVDSNILIFERIKEELKKGKSLQVATTYGFARAMDAIKDANSTTLLVSFILFNPFNWSFLPQFGLIKGFAVTLAIGVATSLFTGVIITRRLLEWFVIGSSKKV